MRFDDLIIWHPYPAEEPPKSGEYLITKTFASGVSPYVMYEVAYSKKYNKWNWYDSFDPEKEQRGDSFTPYTTAWAEMPQVTPYEG